MSLFPYGSFQWKSNKPKIQWFGELCHGQKYGVRYTNLVPVSVFLCGHLNYRAMLRIGQILTGSLEPDPELWQK